MSGKVREAENSGNRKKQKNFRESRGKSGNLKGKSGIYRGAFSRSACNLKEKIKMPGKVRESENVGNRKKQKNCLSAFSRRESNLKEKKSKCKFDQLSGKVKEFKNVENRKKRNIVRESRGI